MKSKSRDVRTIEEHIPKYLQQCPIDISELDTL